HGGQGQERTVDGIGVEVVVDTGSHDDLGPALGIIGILGEFPADADGLVGRDSGELLLPGGCAHDRIVVVHRPFTGQVEFLTVDTVVGEHDIEDGGELPATDLHGGHATGDDTRADRAGLPGAGGGEVKAGEEQLCGTGGSGGTRDLGDGHDRVDAILTEVPFAHALLTPAVGDGAARVDDLTVGLDGEQAVGGVGRGSQVRGEGGRTGGGEELARGVGAVTALIQFHQEGRV